MRKFYVIFLLGIFALSQIGYHFAFLYQQHTLRETTKKNIIQHLPEEEMTVFQLSKIQDKIDWKERDEFSLEGNMYDLVKKVITKNGETILYAVADAKEDAMLAKYYAGLKSKSEKKQVQTPLVNFTLYPPESGLTTIQEYAIIQLQYFDIPLQEISQGHQLDLYAPPRIA